MEAQVIIKNKLTSVLVLRDKTGQLNIQLLPNESVEIVDPKLTGLVEKYELDNPSHIELHYYHPPLDTHSSTVDSYLTEELPLTTTDDIELDIDNVNVDFFHVDIADDIDIVVTEVETTDTPLVEVNVKETKPIRHNNTKAARRRK